MKRFEYLTTEEALDRVNRYTRGTTWHNKKDQVRVLAMDKDRTLYHIKGDTYHNRGAQWFPAYVEVKYEVDGFRVTVSEEGVRLTDKYLSSLIDRFASGEKFPSEQRVLDMLADKASRLAAEQADHTERERKVMRINAAANNIYKGQLHLREDGTKVRDIVFEHLIGHIDGEYIGSFNLTRTYELADKSGAYVQGWVWVPARYYIEEEPYERL